MTELKSEKKFVLEKQATKSWKKILRIFCRIFFRREEKERLEKKKKFLIESTKKLLNKRKEQINDNKPYIEKRSIKNYFTL